MKLLAALLVLLPLGPSPSSNSTAHKFYVSTATIRHNPKAKTLEISLQVFIDDAENLLNTQSDTPLILDPDSDAARIANVWEKYLQQSFVLRVEERQVAYDFLGKEYRNDLMISYIEVPMDTLPEKLHITNTLFFKLFDTQKNIVHVQTAAGRKSFLLEVESPSTTIDFSSF